MEEFSKPQYKVDVLKVEVPINRRVRRRRVFTGAEGVYARPRRSIITASARPLRPSRYLPERRREQRACSLRTRTWRRSGTDFSGVLCGRATWKDGIPIYASEAVEALEDWLPDKGCSTSMP